MSEMIDRVEDRWFSRKPMAESVPPPRQTSRSLFIFNLIGTVLLLWIAYQTWVGQGRVWLTTDTQRAPISSPFGPTVYTEGGPIGWVLASQFLVTSYGNPTDVNVINSILLEGKSRISVGFKEAYAVSNLTGRRQSFVSDVPDKGSYPVTKVNIPPQADVHLRLDFNPPLNVRDFLDQWGKFRAVIVYDDGTTWEHEFDEAYVRERLNRIIPQALGPRVTVKDDK